MLKCGMPESGQQPRRKNDEALGDPAERGERVGLVHGREITVEASTRLEPFQGYNPEENRTLVRATHTVQTDFSVYNTHTPPHKSPSRNNDDAIYPTLLLVLVCAIQYTIALFCSAEGARAEFAAPPGGV